MIRHKRVLRVLLGISLLTSVYALFVVLRNSQTPDGSSNLQDDFWLDSTGDFDTKFWSSVKNIEYEGEKETGINFEDEYLIPVTKKSKKKTSKKPTTKTKIAAELSAKPTLTITESGSVTKFIYHAVHKTGSSIIREELRAFCSEFELTCLSYDFCEPKPSMGQCSENIAKLSGGKQRNVDYGSFTAFRLLHGCCPALEESNEQEIQFDALIEHFPLHLAENRQFLDDRFDAEMMFRFTFLRNPVQQFISNYKMHKKMRYQKLSNLPPLNVAINELYNADTNENYELPENLRIIRDIIVNCQAKELGWDRTRKGLATVVDGLKQFDFVGIFESMEDSWKILRRNLKWPAKYFDSKKLSTIALKKKYVLPKSLMDRIEELQYADMELYDEAVMLLESEL